jgi:hypothetical protein
VTCREARSEWENWRMTWMHQKAEKLVSGRLLFRYRRYVSAVLKSKYNNADSAGYKR